MAARKLTAGWKIDNHDKACYIDVEEHQDDNIFDDDFDYTESQWSDLPDLLLEQIFSYLHIRERYYASLVCSSWYRAFYLPRVWSNFLVVDETLTHPKYNYYSGWQYVLDHARTQNCLLNVGKFIKGLDFRPTFSFHNMYQFMSLFSWAMEQNQSPKCPKEWKGCGSKVKSLNYIFPCNMAAPDDPDGVKLFGTGGQLLSALKRLLYNMTNLQKLKLIDLMLERYEAKHLLDEVLESCCLQLKRLHLVNVTSVHCPIMHAGCFLNLKVLVISPQNIDDDILQLITDSKIRHLYLLQNRYTPTSTNIAACSVKAWRSLKRDNPKLLVHLRVESQNNCEILLQPEAPVYSMIYQAPKSRISSELILRAVDMYKHTLGVYGHETLPRYISPKQFHNRVDGLFVLMARSCPNLNVLMIREKISTATVLLLARTSTNLQFFYVRRNHVVLKCDWPKNPDWSDDFYAWLKIASRSYEATEKEVSQILQTKWTMLSDKEYKGISLKQHVDH